MQPLAHISGGRATLLAYLALGACAAVFGAEDVPGEYMLTDTPVAEAFVTDGSSCCEDPGCRGCGPTAMDRRGLLQLAFGKRDWQ